MWARAELVRILHGSAQVGAVLWVHLVFLEDKVFHVQMQKRVMLKLFANISCWTVVRFRNKHYSKSEHT